ncbi:RNA polymerase sigma-70 factor (ECF subfamily) [Sphingopyxis italica]|uniref:RNA polymerase sigma-70 factor (ECF subfamily) n=2 Tax=Sphingopyxis italica TaxID=1129133 RepID=A0A7X5XTQ9_9SPHN|nr:sigma-70 family RNA polymerase sigma factor [Sphingopyxis italica]NJB90808.1 RNA polymerase sigma-70 factor (ECF subfamily) [Sphingopyxis italica]
MFAKQVLNARLAAFVPNGKAAGMDFEDKDSERPGIAGGDPLPPEDWERVGRSARIEAIYSEHRPHITRFFRGRAPNQDVGDLVQEVFSRFASARGGLAALVEGPGAYLVKSARMLLAEYGRADGRRHRSQHDSFSDEHEGASDPHAALEARDVLRRAERAISRLSPLTREIFLMHRFEGLRYPEIARIKGISVKTVESHMTKALAAIKRARGKQ